MARITPTRVVRGVKRRADRLTRMATGRWLTCNLCGWSGPVFHADNFHPSTVCPQCDSHVRHRLLAAAMMRLPDVAAEQLVRGRSVLHFAPEPAIARFLRADAGSYQTADFLAVGYSYDVDWRLDIANMDSIADGQFDVVVACDVLEHVPDDRAAMLEIHRVLAPGGWAVLTVPQQDGLDVTFEDWTAVTEEARERAFGQRDHLRIYGNNFGALLEGAGFNVIVADHTSFPARVVRGNVLFPPQLSTHRLATNHRRVFFAQRPRADR